MPAFHDELRVAVPSRVPDLAELEARIAALEGIVARSAAGEVIPELQRIVPNYRRGVRTAAPARAPQPPAEAPAGADGALQPAPQLKILPQ